MIETIEWCTICWLYPERCECTLADAADAEDFDERMAEIGRCSVCGGSVGKFFSQCECPPEDLRDGDE